MDARFMAFFIVFVCVFAPNNSEGRKKLGENIYDNGVQDIHKHMAEQAWDFCKKELGSSLSHSGNVCVEFGCSAESFVHKAIDDLPPKEKNTILHCLREKNFPFKELKEEKSTFPKNLFTGWASIPRRYLGTRRQALDTPESADSDYPPLSDAKLSASKTKAVAPDNSIKYLAGAVIAGVLSGLGLVAIVIYFCRRNIDARLQPKDGLRDEKPLLNFSPSNMSAGSSENSHVMGTPIGLTTTASSLTTSGSSLDAHCVSSSQAGIQPTEANPETAGKKLLPLPPGRAPVGEAMAAAVAAVAAVVEAAPVAAPVAEVAPVAAAPAGEVAKVVEVVAEKPPPPPPVASAPPPAPAPAPGPAPPTLPTPAPPPPPRGGRRPPPPNPPPPGLSRPSPHGSHHRRTSTGDSSIDSDESEAPKTKLKPFFWDKVLASPDQSMVWHELKAGSFQFNEEMMEALFGYATADKKKNEKKSSASEVTPQFIQIIDAKKAQNLAILLKALNVTTEEVCSALKEGNELPSEFIQTLLKMAPTADEELKLRLYSGEITLLGPAERFLKGVVDIPFAFRRMEALLFMSTFQEEFSSIKVSFATLEVACTELRSSRLFLKLLEAVLKTGNRMNDGTYRGGAQAFKLETLLKLSDVKGTDGTTSLLHFVVHEIIRGEGVRAARKLRESSSMSSVRTEDLIEESTNETEEYHRNLGLQVVSGLSNELHNVKKAALIDNDMVSEAVSKLSQSRIKTKAFLEKEMKDLGEESEFFETLTSFVAECESDVAWVVEEEKRIMDLVKSTGDYFHGKGGRDEGVHLFVIVRDFLLMVDKTCVNIKTSIKMPTKPQKKSVVASLSPSPSHESPCESARDIQQRLFPALRARQMDDDEFSSEDET